MGNLIFFSTQIFLQILDFQPYGLQVLKIRLTWKGREWWYWGAGACIMFAKSVKWSKSSSRKSASIPGSSLASSSFFSFSSALLLLASVLTENWCQKSTWTTKEVLKIVINNINYCVVELKYINDTRAFF